MVIGESFAWGHLMKTGGDATCGMFAVFPRLIAHMDGSSTEQKHAPFCATHPLLQNKVLALNIRRLPAWLLSRAHHLNQHGGYPEYRPQPMQSPESMACSHVADLRLNTFTDAGRVTIHRWLRMESLAADFLSFVGEFTAITAEEKERVLAHALTNATSYDHALPHWFSTRQLQTMYRNNPLWAAVETRVYGHLLSDRKATKALGTFKKAAHAKPAQGEKGV